MKFDLDPESWRRCRTCYGRLVRVTSDEQLTRHTGHHLIPAEGFHINEFFRILIGRL